jgi:hypothetical protein
MVAGWLGPNVTGSPATVSKRFREIAMMEMQPRVRARLLEVAGEYQRLVDNLAGQRREDRKGDHAARDWDGSGNAPLGAASAAISCADHQPG